MIMFLLPFSQKMDEVFLKRWVCDLWFNSKFRIQVRKAFDCFVAVVSCFRFQVGSQSLAMVAVLISFSSFSEAFYSLGSGGRLRGGGGVVSRVRKCADFYIQTLLQPHL